MNLLRKPTNTIISVARPTKERMMEFAQEHLDYKNETEIINDLLDIAEKYIAQDTTQEEGE
jgi:hypothetical protein